MWDKRMAGVEIPVRKHSFPRSSTQDFNFQFFDCPYGSQPELRILVCLESAALRPLHSFSSKELWRLATQKSVA